MSRGGWARLRKEQQQQQHEMSTQCPIIYSEDDGIHQVHKCKKLLTSKEQRKQLNKAANYPLAPLISTPPNISTSSASSPASTVSSLSAFNPPSGHQLVLPLDHKNCIGAGKLLRIVRQWKAFTAKSRSRRPPARSSSSCRRLHLVRLSCISSSSSQLSSDFEREEDDFVYCSYELDTPSDSDSKYAKISSSPSLNPYQSRSPQACPADPQSSCRAPSIKINTKFTGKEREFSSCEKKTQPIAARRALSCPKLRSSLSLPILDNYTQAEVDEELEKLQPKKKEAAGRRSDGGNTKLRRSSSSPLRRLDVSKQPSTPKGYLALYVGEERKRFLVKANVVNHPMFSVLLDKAKEEFGFDQKGGLEIPCDTAFFQHIMLLVESNQKAS